MIVFELGAIKVEIRAELERSEYKDANNRKRTHFERKVKTLVKFWDFPVRGNLQELSLIKSSLIYFMQGYWKRSGKEASKIDLATEIIRHHPNGTCGNGSETQILNFAARQKNKKSFLHISLQRNGSIVNEVYFNGQEVLMLDVAIGKGINFLTPTIDRQGDFLYDY
ncbi:hypothetical protein [uncultured Desulfobulbus sp.]|uniref:hypothetical protein n=1 Tax=uncultured Desulfobulbus sp. TaxID=239745 RepID=UPI0029C7EE8C|nr:hypothetical protein [uncultured Desulfobulbus sp.]